MLLNNLSWQLRGIRVQARVLHPTPTPRCCECWIVPCPRPALTKLALQRRISSTTISCQVLCSFSWLSPLPESTYNYLEFDFFILRLSHFNAKLRGLKDPVCLTCSRCSLNSYRRNEGEVPRINSHVWPTFSPHAASPHKTGMPFSQRSRQHLSLYLS